VQFGVFFLPAIVVVVNCGEDAIAPRMIRQPVQPPRTHDAARELRMIALGDEEEPIGRAADDHETILMCVAVRGPQSAVRGPRSAIRDPGSHRAGGEFWVVADPSGTLPLVSWDCGSRTADRGLRIADCGSQTADRGLRTADSERYDPTARLPLSHFEDSGRAPF
jgi:hypothetical protein